MMPNVLHSEIWYVTKNSSFENELPHKGLCHSFGSSSCLLGWYEFTLIQSLSRLLLICILTSWGKCPLCTSHCWWQNLFLGMLSWFGKKEPFYVRVLQGACCHLEGPQRCCLGEMKYNLAQMDKVILFQLEKKKTCAEDSVSEFAVTDRSLGSIVEVIFLCISFNFNNSHEMSQYICKYPPTGITAFIAVHWPAKVWPHWLTQL